jgi:hypothetical protein
MTIIFFHFQKPKQRDSNHPQLLNGESSNEPQYNSRQSINDIIKK